MVTVPRNELLYVAISATGVHKDGKPDAERITVIRRGTWEPLTARADGGKSGPSSHDRRNCELWAEQGVSLSGTLPS